MKTKNYLLSLVMLFCFIAASKAQMDGFTIAFDPVPLIWDGYGVEAGFNFDKNRIGFSYSTHDVPEFLNSQHEKFSVNSNAIDGFYSRFAKEDLTGLHYGLNIGYVFKEAITEEASGQTKEDNFMRAGLRLGYFIYPFMNKGGFLSGFYLEPQINANIAISPLEVAFANQTYKASYLTGSLFTFNVGWKL